MWRLLPILAVLANFILTVTCANDSLTIITVQNKAEAGSIAGVGGGNSTAVAGAAASASSTTVVKTGQHHHNATNDSQNIITVQNKAEAGSIAGVQSGNGTAVAGAAALARSTTVIKTGHHHHTAKKCAANEKYVKCPEKMCQPQVCEHVGFPQCSPQEERYYLRKENNLDPETGNEESCTGPPVCVCKDNYVRNDEGDCMHVSNCPSCANDKNATSGCGVNCGRRCSNYDQGPVNCADICYVNSCDCKKGYVFDDYRGFCVLAEDCSNKDAPELEGTKGTTEKVEGEDTDTKPCDDCNRQNCDPKNTTSQLDGGEKKCATEEKDGEGGTEGPEKGDNMKTLTEKAGSNAELNSSSTESHMTTSDGSETASSVHAHKKKKRRRTTTTISSGEPSSSTETMAMTTQGPEIKSTTEVSKIHTTIKESESEAMTVGSGTEMESTTHTHVKKKRRKTTTTAPCGSEMTTDSSVIETTKNNFGKETTADHSSMEMTTKHSGMDTTTDHGMQTTSDATDDSGKTTTVSLMITTVEHTTTTKGPYDCKAKNEWYNICAPTCPQKTCADYLNGVKCPKTIGIEKCKPECRCLLGFYKDEEGNCVSSRECRRLAKSTTVDKDTNAIPTTTMMTTTPAPKCEDIAYDLFVIGNLRYTTKLLIDQSQRDPGNNILVGGASILFLFAQLALEAKDPVKTELLDAFNLISLEQVRCLFPKISAELTATYPDIEYSLFCKIYANVDYALTNDFIQRTTDLFVIGPENLNFSSSEAVKKINSEVAQATNDRFQNFIKLRTLKPLNGLVLTDAEAFQGKWEKQFNPKDTTLRDFFWEGGVDKIPFMYLRTISLYHDSLQLNAKVLKLKYSGGRFTLAIILPNRKDGLSDLLKRMENPQNTASAFDSLKNENVEMYIPRIDSILVANRLKSSSEMDKITLAFNNATTGFEAIGSAKSPFVSDILQKMRYSVNEFGMGDKMDNAFHAEISRLPKPGVKHVFKADHPFAFFLLFEKIALFAGTYEH